MKFTSRLAMLGLSCLMLSQIANGQALAPAAMSPGTGTAVLVGDAGPNVLRIGTKVPLKLAEDLTTKGKKLRMGQHFQLEVAEPVSVNGQVVIPAGAPATGEITDVRNKGMWGRSGHLAAQLLYVTVGGRQVRLTGVFDDKGTAGGIGAVAVSAIVFAPTGFLITGTSAHIPVGAPVTGFIGEDVPLAFAASAPAPLVVSATSTVNGAASGQK